MAEAENGFTIKSVSAGIGLVVLVPVWLLSIAWLISIPPYWIWNYSISPKKAHIDTDRMVITEVISPFGSAYKPNSLSLNEGRVIFYTPALFSSEVSEEVIVPSTIKNVRLDRGIFYDKVVLDCGSWSNEKRLYFRKDETADLALEMISQKIPKRY